MKYSKQLVLLPIVVSLLITSCSEEKNSNGHALQQESLSIDLDSQQVVLTNEYAFKDGRYSKGGAAFVIRGQKDNYLCTAKHMLGEAMSISPKVPTNEFEAQLNYWKCYAPDANLFADTIEVRDLVNEKPSQTDIILLRQHLKSEKVASLTPAFYKLEHKQRLELIACEQGLSGQKRYELEVYDKNNNAYIVRAIKRFNPQLMSGSPVLDKRGRAVGVLVGGGVFEGELYLTVEPLSLVKKFIE